MGMSEAIDEKFLLISEDNEGTRTLDLMRLSEIFSRAGEGAMESPQFASMFNEYAMRICRQLSSPHRDQKVTKNAHSIMAAMTLAARDHSVNRIILPMHQDSEVASFFRDSVLQGYSFENHYHVGIEFIDDCYKLERRVTRLGQRRPEAHTALHYKFDKPTSPSLD